MVCLLAAISLARGQSSARQALPKDPTTPEAAARAIVRLAWQSRPPESSVEGYFSQFWKQASRELFKISRCSEASVLGVARILDSPSPANVRRGLSLLKDGDDTRDYQGLVLFELWLTLMHEGPKRKGGLTPAEFGKYHVMFAVPEGQELTFDYPWTKRDGTWFLVPFELRMDAGLPTFTSLYEDFSKLPRRFR